MNRDILPLQRHRLAAWLGWFEANPMPTEFAVLIAQLEAAGDTAQTEPTLSL